MAEAAGLSSSSSSPTPHSSHPCHDGDRILLLQRRPYFNFGNSIKDPETRTYLRRFY
jgi:hypothetical protein